jgi:hypothetical protein
MLEAMRRLLAETTTCRQLLLKFKIFYYFKYSILSLQKLPKAQKDTAVEKKPKKVGPLGSRERLAKKLGLNRKK